MRTLQVSSDMYNELTRVSLFASVARGFYATEVERIIGHDLYEQIKNEAMIMEIVPDLVLPRIKKEGN